MKRYCFAALAAMITACGSGDGIITKPDTPATKVPDRVIFSKSKLLVLTGESVDFGGKYTTNPSGATLSWASSDTNLATVLNGVITGKGFGVVTVSVTPIGGTPTEAKIWVANPVTSLKSAVTGCPTQAEVNFVLAAVSLDFSTDTNTAMCTVSTETVPMLLRKARAIRSITATAGLKFGPLSWAPNSTNLFEWLVFDSGMQGIEFLPLQAGRAGQCCHLGWIPGTQGVIQISTLPVINDFNGRAAIYFFISSFVHEAHHIKYGAHKCGQLDSTLAEQGPFAAQYAIRNVLSQNAVLAEDERVQVAADALYDRQHDFCSIT
jgi:hypothetical protein